MLGRSNSDAIYDLRLRSLIKQIGKRRCVHKSKAVVCGLVAVAIILAHSVRLHAFASSHIWGFEEPRTNQTKPSMGSASVVDPNPRNGTVMWHCHMGILTQEGQEL